jgi:hypothetical protein
MKIILVLILTFNTVFTATHAQHIAPIKVPGKVKAAFVKLHGSTRVSWEVENLDYEAGFILKGKKASEVYSTTGILLESEVEIKISVLPDAIKLKLQTKNIREAARISRTNGEVLYEAKVSGRDLLFDANGNPVK